MVHCFPGCYPGLYSSWGFAPSLFTASTVAQHLELSFLWGLRPVFVQRDVYVWNLNRGVTVVLHCLLLLFKTLFIFFTVPVCVTLSDVLFSFTLL